MLVSTCVLFSLVVSLVIAYPMLFVLRNLQKSGQPVRIDGPAQHLLSKKNTPAMGGLIIIFSVIFTVILFMKERDNVLLVVLFNFLAFAIIGGIDDYLKIKKYTSIGLSGRLKFLLQFFFAALSIFYLKFVDQNFSTETHLFFGNLINLGWLYYPFAILVIVGSSNAVNLTDGLDGLVTVPVILAAIGLSIISGVSDPIALFSASLVGACIGFLWVNSYPAKIFMGDIGSLSIGASLGMMSVIAKHELAFAIIGGLFVIETLSVILQVSYFKYTKKFTGEGRRIFLMSPIHHHFEKKGWVEQLVVVRFWIVSCIFLLISLSMQAFFAKN